MSSCFSTYGTLTVDKSKEANAEDQKPILGLDDIQDEIDQGKTKVFGEKKSMRSTISASSRALFQYFAKLGNSEQEYEVVDLDFVETLINSGANINSCDKHGQTLLHEVASKWHIDVAKFLIKMDANVNQADNYGRTPLHVAAADNYPEMVHLLIDHGADKHARTDIENQTPVHYAARNDAVDSLKALIKRKCEYKMVLDYKGRTPLHVAAQLDRSDTARLLLDLKAPAFLSDDEGQATMAWMIEKMPPVVSISFNSAGLGLNKCLKMRFVSEAAEGLQQFHVRDRPNRKQRFYLNLLCPDREKDPKFRRQMAMQVAVKHKQFHILTHSVFLSLIKIMWKQFARWRAVGGLIFNFLYIMLWTVYGVFIEYDVRHVYKLPEQWWRIVLLIASVGITVWQIIDEIREYRRSKANHEEWVKWRMKEIEADLKFCHPRWPEEKKFLDSEQDQLKKSHTKYLSDWWNWFDWFCYALLLSVIGTHVADIVHHTDAIARAHIRLTAVVVIFLWLRLMKNIRAFATLGPFVVMVAAMLTDLIRFAFLYFEFYIPYVCAMWMIFGGNKYPVGSAGDPNRTEVTVPGFATFNEAMFSMWRMTLVDEYSYEDMRGVDPIMADILVGTWLFLSAVLCLNLLIALFSDTFQRVYDNARANAVMQKAVMILSFWEDMSPEAKRKFLDYIQEECSPLNEYYDDDMTESDDADLKKVTIQIKEDLDSIREKWDDQFGDAEPKSALNEWEELEEEDTPKEKGGKMITQQKFEDEIGKLRHEITDGLIELQKQQLTMMNKFKQDLKMVKSLLLDLSPHSGGGGGSVGRSASGHGGSDASYTSHLQPYRSGVEILPMSYQGTFAQSDLSRLPPPSGSNTRKKGRKKQQRDILEREELLLPGETGGQFAPSPLQHQQPPQVEVSTQDYVSVTDPHSVDHSTA
ncbi:hypothetical protein ACF0H5_007588 [Mactra antiquata]